MRCSGVSRQGKDPDLSADDLSFAAALGRCVRRVSLLLVGRFANVEHLVGSYITNDLDLVSLGTGPVDLHAVDTRSAKTEVLLQGIATEAAAGATDSDDLSLSITLG